MKISVAQAKKLGILPKGMESPSRGRPARKPSPVPPAAARPEPAAPVSFVIPGHAVPKERARTVDGGTHTYTPDRTSRFSKAVRGYGMVAMHGFAPMSGPVRALVVFYFAPPKSWPEWKRAAALEGRLMPTGRPDVDNVAKNILDALNGCVYLDDSQVFSKLVEKHYAPTERIEVRFEAVAALPSSVKKPPPGWLASDDAA